MKGIRHSRAVSALLLAVLLLGRLVVPAGWMPIQTERGFAIMLCSGNAPVEAWIDGAGKVHLGKHDGADKPGDDHQPKDPCPFAALTAPADVPGPLSFAGLPATSAPALPTIIPLPVVGQGLAAPPPPSTGPPHSA